MNKRITYFLITVPVMIAFAFQILPQEIPKTWDIRAIKIAHLPPPDTSVKVNYASEA